MAKCSVCNKGAHFGIKVSHSHRRANKMWKSNVTISDNFVICKHIFNFFKKNRQ